MKTIKFGLLLTGLLILTTTALAMDDFPLRPGAVGSFDEADNIILDEVHVLNVGAFDFAITNSGYLGNDGPERVDAMVDPCTGLWAPQFEYPRGSGIQHLYQGGLWVGALIETDEEDVPRVSVATEGWFADASLEYEATSPISQASVQQGRMSCDGQEISDPGAFAPIELTSSMVDTSLLLPTGSVRRHPLDGDHQPLGLEITQHVLGFSAVNYDKFAIIEYTIENIGTTNLKDLCVGMYIDADIGAPSTQEYTDDITGFLREYGGQNEDIAWIADGTGRQVGSGEYDARSVFGLTILQSPNEAPLGGYNWWVSNTSEALDFGPAWQRDENHWTETYGTPVDDARKYELLRNGEIDYDQYRVNDPDWIEAHPQETIDPESGQPVTRDWLLDDLVDADDLADGFDTRFLLSWGPLGTESEGVRHFGPGARVTLAVAVLVGDDFHDPDHPQPEDGIDPSLFNFEDLVATARRARSVYSDLAENAPPAPPMQATIYRGFTGTVLSWPALATLDDVAYNIFRHDSEEGNEWPTVALNDQPIIGTSFVDRNANLDQQLYYRIQAIRHDTLTSYQSQSWAVPRDAVTPISQLNATAGDRSIQLEWNPLPEQMVEHYNVFRTEDIDLDFSEWELIATIDEAVYTDNDDELVNGKYYWYGVVAVVGVHISMPAITERQIPMGLNDNLLVIVEYGAEGEVNNWQLEDIEDFYTSLLPESSTPSGYREVDLLTADTLLLSDLADYGTVWLAIDRAIVGDSHYSLVRDRTLRLYSELGGNLLVSGQNLTMHLSGDDSFHTPELVPLATILGYESLDRCIHSFTNPDQNFSQAVSLLDGSPHLSVDEEKSFVAHYIGIITRLTALPEATPLYSFVSYGGSTEYEGEMIAVFNPATENHGAAIFFGVPIYGLAPQADVASAVGVMLGMLSGDVSPIAPPPQGQDNLVLGSDEVRVHPNPFNAVATVSMNLGRSMEVGLQMYNLLGQEVMSISPRRLSAGQHNLSLDGRSLPSGLYFLRLQLGQEMKTQKVLLLK